MKKVISFFVNSISWVIMVLMIVYIVEITMDISSYFIDLAFSMLQLERGTVVLFFLILIVVFCIIFSTCLIRYVVYSFFSKKEK